MKQHEKEFFDSINQIIKEEFDRRKINEEKTSFSSIAASTKPPDLALFKQELSNTLDRLYKIDVNGFITTEENPRREHYNQVLEFLNLQNSTFEQIIQKISDTFMSFYKSKLYKVRNSRTITSRGEKGARAKFTGEPNVKLSPNEFLGYMILYKTLKELRLEEESGTSGYNFENFCAYLLKGRKIGEKNLEDVEANGVFYTCKVSRANASIRIALSSVINYFGKKDSIQFILMSTGTTTNVNYLKFSKRTLDIRFLKFIIQSLVSEEVYQENFPQGFSPIGDEKNFFKIKSYEQFSEYVKETQEKSILLQILYRISQEKNIKKQKSPELFAGKRNQKASGYLELLNGVLHFTRPDLVLNLGDGDYVDIGEIPIREDFIENFYDRNMDDVVKNYLTVMQKMLSQIQSIELLMTKGTDSALSSAKQNTQQVKTALNNIKI